MKELEEENEKLSEKAARFSSALRFAHKQGKHLDNVALYWREYV
jgi:hypothetical protein